MATVVETTLVDSGHLSDLFGGVKKETPLVEHGHFTEALTDRHLALLTDTGHITEVLSGKQSQSPVSTDIGHLTDLFSQSVRRDLVITGTFGTILTDSKPAILTDTGHITDTLTKKVTSKVTIFDTGSFTTTLFDNSGADSNQVNATGTFSTSITQRVRARSDLVIHGTFSDLLAQFHFVVDQLSMTGLLTDALQQTAVVHPPVLEDEIFGEVFAVSTPQVAWTTSSDSWAMSRQEHTSLDSLASLDGTLFGAAVTGIVAFEPGGEVDAWFESRIMDFGSDYLKTTTDLYVGYISEQPLTVTMTSTQSGEAEESFAYDMPERIAATWIPGRVKLGRGLRSRYMRYRIANTSGGDFELDSVKFLTQVLTRRV